MIVTLLHWLIRLALAPIVAPLLAWRRRVPKGAWIYADVDGPVALLPPRRTLPLLPASRALSLRSFDALCKEIASDERLRGLVVILRGFEGSLSLATAMRASLAALRTAGKEVIVHLPVGGGNKELVVASAASKLIVGPQTTLSPVGFASTAHYLKDALDRVGVGADVISRGTYKSAGETLNRSSMSEAQREQVGALLDELYDALVAAIASGRSMSVDQAKALVDRAPLLARDARDAKLVDDLAYEDELPARLGSTERPATLIEAARYHSARRARVLPALRRKRHVAVLAVRGPIVDKAPGLALGQVAAAEPFIAAVRAARMSRRVAGVVLWIDSPGGSALASDRMFHELSQLAREKPLVACMGSVAASGGYYVAAAAHVIVAQPTTITGSIGVVAARPIVQPLLERLGVNVQTLQRGRNAGIVSPSKPLSESERDALDREIGAVYDSFVEAVATGRRKPRDEVEAVAQGRVWSGREAHARGLVDVLGGFDAAVGEVARLSGRAVEKLEVAQLRAPWGRIPPLPLPRPPPAAAVEALARLAGIDPSVVAMALSGSRVLAWCPVRIDAETTSGD